MNRAAMLALAEALVAIELLEQWRKIPHDAFQLDLGAMQQLVAVLAVPLEPIQRPFRPWHFDHNTDRSRLQALRRVTHMLGKQEYLPFLNRDFERRLARRFHQAKKNIALQLIKEFFRRVVVIIAPVI